MAPTLSSFTPTNNATGEAVTVNIVLNFNENVTAVSGKNIIIKKKSDDSNIVSIDAGNPTNATIQGGGSQTIVVNPTNDLPEGTEMYVNIEAGAFKNGSNQNYAGINDTGATFSFTTANTAPTLSSSNPADNATEVAVDANIVLTFSENVTAVASKNITIKKTSDDSTVATIAADDSSQVSIDNATVTINPSSNLPQSTEMYVLIDSGAFKDSADNNYAGISSTTALSFTTTNNPTLLSSVPANNATGVALDANIVLNFSEAVDAESGNIVIKKSSDDSVIETIDVTSAQVTGTGTNIITINPVSSLPESTQVYITIAETCFDDAAGNSYAGINNKTTIIFTTGVKPGKRYPHGGWKNPDYLNPITGNKKSYGGGNTKYSAPGSQGRPSVMFNIVRKKT